MPLEDFMIHVYLIVDDFFKTLPPVRKGGFAPKLTDVEIVSMEIIGETLCLGSDKRIYDYFARHWREWFPHLGRRTNFVRQGANLWELKESFRKSLLQKLTLSSQLFLFDRFPIPTCHTKRVRRKNPFWGTGAFGYCAAKDKKYFGFKGHMVTHESGLILSYDMTPANIDERDVVQELVEDLKGMLIADKGLIRPSLTHALAENDLTLQTPLRDNMMDPRPKPFLQNLMSIRRTIETVISQLVDRFHIQSIKAKDLWHLSAKIGRKILAHTCCFFVAKSLQFNPILS